MYPEFKSRYNIIGASAVAKAKNDKAAAQAVMDILKLDKEKFRLGHTKVFFRAGIGAWMEEQRENKIGSVLAWLQAQARGKAARMKFKKLQDQKMALYACQRAIRSFMMAKTWLWLQIWLAIKPTLKCTQFGKFKKEYEDKIAEAEANIDGAIAARAKVQAVYDGLAAQKNALEGTIAKTNATVAGLEAEVGNQEGLLSKAEQDRADKDDQIRTLKDEISHQGEMITKLGKEKRGVADSRQKTEEDIQAAEDKCNHLSRVKGKLEQALDEAEDALERKKKVEGDLKLTQEAVSDLERVKGELQGAAARKDKEGSALAAKIDDEATLGSKYAKQAKELQARLEELDEELAVERG